MIFHGEKQNWCIRFVVLILPLGLLLGCASTSQKPDKSDGAAAQPVTQDRAVVGGGAVGGASSADRTIINSSNQQIFDAEHSAGAGSATPQVTPTTGIP